MNTSDDALLRTLDPAPATLDAAQRERASALLERVVASPVPAASSPYAARPRSRTRRLAWVAAAFGGLSVGALALPGVLGGGMAYASWTATPSQVLQRDLDAAVAACRDELADYKDIPSENTLVFDAATLPVALADRRGDIVSVVLAQDAPMEVVASCLVTIKAGSGEVDDTGSGLSGSSGPAWVPGAKEFSEGSMTGYGDEAWQVSGHAGKQVAAVTLHLGSTTVEATVKDGRYTAWGPGQAFTNLDAPSGEGGPEPMFTYDVRLTDGTVLTNVNPSHPS